MRARTSFDVAVVGGGPAGLSAALFLGRCRHRVVLFDDGHPRNAVSRGTHGFFTRDGTPPPRLLALGRAQLQRYGITIVDRAVTRAKRARTEFIVETGRRQCTSRALILATGLHDELPAIEGSERLYGSHLFHCPYCDGWEMRDTPLAAYGNKAKCDQFALGLRTWSKDIVWLTGGSRVSPAKKRALVARGVRVDDRKIANFERVDRRWMAVRFTDGTELLRRAIFFDTHTTQRSALIEQLAPRKNRRGHVKCDAHQATSMPGLYVAGDAACGLNFVAVAVAEGVTSAFGVHQYLRAQNR